MSRSIQMGDSDGVRAPRSKSIFTARSTLSDLFLCFGKALSAFARGTWQIIAARQDLERLVDLDDRMLADIGLRRSDLHAAQSAPPWQDPTSILLQQRASRRSAAP
jgi:uncharacterized protein YjiS (DUF1127 family)